MKLLAVTTAAGIEIVSSFSAPQSVIEAAASEVPEVLGSFGVSMAALAKVEYLGFVPFGGTGIVILYDATPGSFVGSREVLRSLCTSATAQRRVTQAVELKADHIYQIRAACVDESPSGKAFVLQSAQMVDA